MTVAEMQTEILAYLALGNVTTDRLTPAVMLAAINVVYEELARDEQIFRYTHTLDLDTDGICQLPARVAEIISVQVSGNDTPLARTRQELLDYKNVNWRVATPGIPEDYFVQDMRYLQVNPPPSAGYDTAYVEARVMPAVLVNAGDSPTYASAYHRALVYLAVVYLAGGLLHDDPNAVARSAFAQQEVNTMRLQIKQWRA
jgi:hypothetical protein